MPNTSPSIDSASVAAWVIEKARAEACVRVLPTGALSKGIAGEEMEAGFRKGWAGGFVGW
jgi:dihydroorotase